MLICHIGNLPHIWVSEGFKQQTGLCDDYDPLYFCIQCSAVWVGSLVQTLVCNIYVKL